MKKKDIYFLTGIGIGIIITTLIFYIGFLVIKQDNNTNVTLSDEEIITAAENLGMVFIDDIESQETVEANNSLGVNDFIKPNDSEQEDDTITENDSNEVDVNTTENNDLDEADVNITENNTEEVNINTNVNDEQVNTDSNINEEQEAVENVTLTIQPGSTSNDVSKQLFELNLIDNEKEFNDFLVRNNLDRVIRPKKYTFPTNVTESEIIFLITGKQINYN